MDYDRGYVTSMVYAAFKYRGISNPNKTNAGNVDYWVGEVLDSHHDGWNSYWWDRIQSSPARDAGGYDDGSPSNNEPPESGGGSNRPDNVWAGLVYDAVLAEMQNQLTHVDSSDFVGQTPLADETVQEIHAKVAGIAAACTMFAMAVGHAAAASGEADGMRGPTDAERKLLDDFLGNNND